MVIFSAFDGMSCGQIAFIMEGIPFTKYYASEVDKHANAQTKLNFPNTVQLGDIRNVDVSKLDKIDIFIGGSPCQSFSFAGKRSGMATKCKVEILDLETYLRLKSEGFEFEGQSYLFWEYMRILQDIRKVNPDVLFLLENVEMTKKWERVLSEAIGIFGVHIDSALVSAQNRKRIYWTNFRTRTEGFFDELHSDIPQPEDMGILLQDVLQPEDEVDEKYYMSDKMMKYLHERSASFNNGKINIRNGKNKASCITATSHKVDISDNFIRSGVVHNNGVLTENDKSNCIDANYHKGIDNHGQRTYVKVNRSDELRVGCIKFGRSEEGKRMRRESLKQGRDHTPFQAKEIVDIDYEKMNTVTCSPGRDNHLLVREGNLAGFTEIAPGECVDLNHIESDTRRGRKMVDKSHTLMNSKMDLYRYTYEYRLRRLTPTECARLQTVPEWYKWECSDTQQYRMLGNGWTINAIRHIISFLRFNPIFINLMRINLLP